MSSQLDSAHRTTVPAILPYREAGFALHWLRPRSKAPVADGWSTAPVASLDDLRSTYRDGYNVGVRLGEPSVVAGCYLHVFDVDIRDPQQAADAWSALSALLGEIDPYTLPSVVSGSGGESRHLYFVSDRPFYSRKLKVSEGKHRGTDGKWHYDWEIELFGTGKQAAMPPSIHPGTRQPYRWERPFDLDALSLGLAPMISADRLVEIAEPNVETFDYEAIEPLTFKPGQLERELDEISDDRIDDYQDWVTLGQALHHQFGGSRAGYDLWVEQSRRSEKFLEKEMPGKWRSFGRNRRRPVTMASVRQWVLDARRDAFVDEFDDMDDESEEPAELADDLADLIGGGETATDPLGAPAGEDADPLDAPVKLEWVSLLDLNEEGAIRPNLHNLELILKNDTRFSGLAQLNDFTHEIVQRTAPGIKPKRRNKEAKPTRQLTGRAWQVRDPINGDLWSEDRDFQIRSVIEAPKTQGGYGLKVTDRDLKAAVSNAANDHAFHPIREYLEGLVWDGKARVERLWIDYVAAPNDSYHRDVARLMMIAAVARIYEPGHKFDFATILEGIQGKRKSTLIETLGRNWFAELSGDFHDSKQMVELMQGAWIMEIPELNGFNRADVRALKSFISGKKDRVRLAYARRAGEYPRQVIFIGSTNDKEYLKDDTGGRRFWPVECRVPGSEEIDTDRFRRNVDQMWAEAVTLYHGMRAEQPYGTLPLFLSDPESQATAAMLQETRRVESADDATLGKVIEWLDKPIASGGFDESEGKLRDVVCLPQIWEECLRGSLLQYDAKHSAMLGRVMRRVEGWQNTGKAERFPGRGPQKAWRRVSS
jgi:hypothetical protein